ncbi:amidase family protein [Nocardia sp. 004]|uniref:amidase family protein n=1 Tax=Nocardia sp. 004 TaxID=3385978 RepID=UPI0039A0E460
MSDEIAAVADGSISTGSIQTAVPRTIRDVSAADLPDQPSATGGSHRPRGRACESGIECGPASTIAAGVRDGCLLPSRVVADALTRISIARRESNAFAADRIAERAMAEAAAVEQRDDLDVLPLAGVPVVVEPPLSGSTTTADHPIPARLRAAGAVIVGIVPTAEQGRRGGNDAAEQVIGNPWNTTRIAGGSAGALVAAGLVPLGYGDNGLGSVCVAAACCGVFAITPGRYPLADARFCSSPVEQGVLATTVDDAALALAVLAARPDLAEVDPPGRLRIGLVVDPPSRLVRLDWHWIAAARRAASIAAAAGHLVEPAVLPYGNAITAVLLRRLAVGGGATPAPPCSAHLSYRAGSRSAFGWSARGVLRERPDRIERVEARLLEFFDCYDVVITPTLAVPPPKKRGSRLLRRSVPALADLRFAPFPPVWDLVGMPTVSLPMGMHPESRTPVAAQLAGPPGSESTLLRLSAQLETNYPWQRTAS